MEQPRSKEKTPLELFKEEIRALVEHEHEKKKAWETRGKTGNAYNPDLIEVSHESLTEDDRMIFEARKNPTWEDWGAYDSKFEKWKNQNEDIDPEAVYSRRSFKAFIANKIWPLLLRQEKRSQDAKKRNSRLMG